MQTPWLEAVYAAHKIYWASGPTWDDRITLPEVRQQLTQENLQALAELERAVDESKAKMGFKSIFIRFDTRSLKDVPVSDPRCWGPTKAKWATGGACEGHMRGMF